MKHKTILVLLFLIILLGIIYWSIDFLFLKNELLYFQTYGNQLSVAGIIRIINLSKKWQWINYLILPLIVLLRILFTSTFLSIGIFFTELKVNFGKLFRMVVLTDFIYVFSAFTKLVILIFFKEVSTLEDLQFQPFSVMELLDRSKVEPLFVYPLSLLNLFELGYFLLIAWLLVPIINEANAERPIIPGKSLKLVAASYGSGLLLWVLIVMLITINIG